MPLFIALHSILIWTWTYCWGARYQKQRRKSDSIDCLEMQAWNGEKNKPKYVIFHFHFSSLEWIQRIWIGLSKLCVWTRSPKVKNESSCRCWYCFCIFFFLLFSAHQLTISNSRLNSMASYLILVMIHVSSFTLRVNSIIYDLIFCVCVCDVSGSSDGSASNGLAVANFAECFFSFEINYSNRI